MARTLLREGDARVGFVELFYDLVFVFAITQVSHYLLDDFTLRGALEATMIFAAVWWVWIYTTWVLNRLDPERGPVRMLLFALMILGLFLSMAIPGAFADRGLVFAIAFAAMQLGRTAFMYWAGRGTVQIERTYAKIGTWFIVSAVFWIVGGLASGEARLWLWLAALGVEYMGPVVAFWVPGFGRDATTDWTVKGGHMAERCGLFVIIALGETLLIAGATFAGMDWDAPGIAAFLGNVLIPIAMWWVYFHIGHRRGTDQIEHSDDPGRIARLSFTYAHIPIVAGVVLSAVGAERAIAHPADIAQAGEIVSLVGGVALFLAGNGWFKRLSSQWVPLSHVAGLALCAGLAAAGFVLPLWLTSLLAALLLAVVALWEHRSLAASPQVA